MSQTIDQRIVEMRFDNQQFESGVKTSLGTLDRLKNATKIGGNTKVFDGLEKAVGKLNFDGLNSAVQTVSDRFSAFEAIGVGALMRIGSQAVDAGEKLLKSLSIDNISSGWQKFGEKTKSVGTLLAQGFDMADVEKTMDRLNWFTDETSYNLTDMIGNISKFTATGKNLDDSATAMQGIALWAALSGQNASTASRAMYQLSQAMSVGALRQEDYKSIQNASMDTKEFREQALKAAIALGKVEEAEDGIYKIGNKEFTFAEMFTSDALTRTRWLDSDVMMKTFKSYSAAVDSIYEAVRAGDFDTASEAIEKLGGQLDAFGVKAFKAGQEARTWGDVLDSVKDAVGTGWMKTFEMIFGNYEEATKFFTEMANGLWEIFASGGEARNELLRVWKALGGRTELLAGLKFAIVDLLYAVRPLTEAFSEIFPPATAQQLVDLAKKFSYLMQNARYTQSTFDKLKTIFKGVFTVIKTGINVVKAFLKGLSPLFQLVAVGIDNFLSLAASVSELIMQYANGLETSGAFAQITETVRTAILILIGVILTAVNAVVSFVNKVRGLIDVFRGLEGGTSAIVEYVNSLHGVDKAAAMVALTLGSLVKIVGTVGSAFVSAISKIASFITSLTKVDSTTSVFDKLREKFEFLKPAIDVAEKAIGILVNAIKNLPATIANLPDKFAALGTAIAGIFGKLNLEGVKTFGELFDKAKKAVSDFFGSFKDTDKIEQAKTKIDALKTSIIQIVDTIKDKLSKVDPAALIAFAFGTALTIAVLNLAGLITKLENFATKLVTLQGYLNDIVLAIQKKIKANTITKVATAFAMLAGSLWLVAQIPTEKLIPAAIALGLLGAEMAGIVAAFELLNKTDMGGSANKFSLAMISFGGGVALLAVAVNLLKDVKLDENLVARLVTIAALMGEIGIAAALLGKFAPSLSKGALFFVGFAAAVTLLVNALVDIAKQPMDDIQNSLDAITQIMIDVSLLTLAASRLHFGSAVALLVAIGDVVLIEKALLWIGKDGVNYDFVLDNIDKFHVVIGTFMGLATVLALASAVGKGMSAAAVGIAVGVGALLLVEQALIRLCDPKLDFVGTDHFLSNLVVVFGSLIIVAGVAVAAAHFAGDATTGIVKVVAMVAGISLIMFAMVELLKAIAAIDDPSKLDKAIVALFAVSVMASILIAVTALTAKAKVQPIIAMVAAVGVIIAGLALLSYVKGDLVTAAITLGGVLVALAIAMASAGKMSEKVNVAGIIAMTAAVGVIAISLNVLAQQDWFALIAAAASLGIVLLSIGGALKLAKDSGDAAFSALAMAVTVVAVAASLSMLADKPWSGLIAAAVAMGIVFATMSAALLMVGDEFSKGVFNLWALCVPLLAATLALSVLADYSWDSLIAAAAALAIVMVSLGLASKLATGSLEGAAAMVILSVAVIAIAAAFKILETVNFEALVPNLVALCVTLAVLVGLGALANMVALGLIALSVAVLAIGAATLMFGNGALLVAEAADKMLDVLIRLSNEGPAAVQKLAQAFLDFVNNTVGKFVSGISDMATRALGTVSDFLTKMIGAVAAKVAPFGQSAGKLMTSFISGIQGKVSNAINVISKCVASMLNAITTKAKSFFSAAQTLITNVYNGIASKVNEVITTVSNMVDQAKASIDNKVKEFETAARDVVQGFVNGITSKFEEVKNAALNFGNKFMEGIRNGLQWHSPPAWINVFGGDTVKGLFDMASSLFGQMQSAGEALLQPYVNGARGKLAEVEDIMSVVNSFGLEGYGNNEMTDPTDWQRQRQVAAGNARRGKHAKPGERHGGGGTGTGTGTGGGGGGGGGSAKEEESELDKLTAKLKDNIDAFSKYENKIGVTGKALLKNLGSWSTGMEGWADRIKFLASEGIDKGLLQKLIDAGPQGAEYVNAFISMTSEELAEAGKAYNESMEAPAKVAQDILALYDENAQKVTEATTIAVEKNVELGESVTDTAKKLGETAEVYSEAVEKPAEAATGVLSSYAEVSGKAAEILDEAITKNKDLVDSVALSTEATESQLKRAQFAYENMRDSLKETIDSQMDIFSEFKTDTELTSGKLIENMESQLNGVTTWSEELNGLISRGIDEGLLQNLAQMGPKGYEYVHAFSQMTDEELSHASELYRNSLTISDEVSRDIAGKWAAAGLNATLGYKQGIASANANEEATKVGEGSTNSLLTSIDAHSPSRKTHEAGVYFVQGFVNGIRESYATATGEITSFAETCVGLLKIYFAPEKFQELGSNIGTGIQNGLNEAITAISTAFDAGGILESYGTLGQNIIQGIITGMTAKTAEAVTTVQTMMTNVNTAITGFNPQLNASGVGLITQLNAGMVSLQATVIATGNTIITQTKQKIDSFKQPYFNSGRDLIQKVIDGFKNRKSTVVNTADDITKSADQKINSYQNTYLQTGETLIEKLRTGVANKQQNVVTTADTLVKAALKAITDTYNDWYAAGQYIIQGLDAGISSMEHIIFEHLRRIAAEAIAAAEEECEIESPSKAFFRIGKFIDLGWVNGIDTYADKVTGAASGLAHNALYTVRDAFSNMASIVSDDISLDPTIRPVLDLTDVENGLTGIDAMLAAQRSLSMSIGGINEEGLRQNRPYVIYLNTSTNLDGQVIATSMDTILGEAL